VLLILVGIMELLIEFNIVELVKEFLKRILQVEFMVREISVENEQEVSYDLEDNKLDLDDDIKLKIKLLVKDWDNSEKEMKITLGIDQIL